MKNILLLKTTLIAAIFMFACNPKIKNKNNALPNLGLNTEQTPTDFSRYFAFGNSLTAGMSDGSLFRSGQQVAYPNIFAMQLKKAGLNQEFRSPFMPGENGVFSDDATIPDYKPTTRGKLILKIIKGSPVIKNLLADADSYSSVEVIDPNNKYPYHNMGVPGIAVADLLSPTFINANLYSRRMMPTSGNILFPVAQKNYINMANDAAPSFFTAWLGANDVLGYAARGGGETNTGAISGDLTALGVFQNNYKRFLDEIYTVSPNAKGVLINVPNILCTAYFTTVKYDDLKLTYDQALVLNKLFKSFYDAGLATNLIEFKEGKNAFVVRKTGSNEVRQLIGRKYEQEIVLLSSQDKIAKMMAGFLSINLAVLDGLTQAETIAKLTQWRDYIITENEFLDFTELANIKNSTNQFNSYISSLVAQSAGKLALIDINEHLCKAANGGVVMDGVTLKSDFLTGGIFSLDGLHATQRGNAYIANILIQTVNKHFNQRIERVNVSSYPDIRPN